MVSRRIAGVCLVALGLSTLAGYGQVCTPQWQWPFPAGDLDGNVYAMAVWDADGAGPNPPALYVGGTFTYARGLLVNKIAKWSWNGTAMTWSALGVGANVGVPSGSAVFALQVWNDGTSEQLYVGGNFPQVAGGGGVVDVNNIAAWNGTTWSRLGPGTIPAGVSNGAVYCMTVFDDDGAGLNPSALYVGGSFLHAGNLANVNRIAKYIGTGWERLGDGTDNFVNALATFDDDGAGANPTGLYAGGGFLQAGGVAMNHIAKWSKVGTTLSWSKLQMGSYDGVNNSVYALQVFDEDGAGPIQPALYVGGNFTRAATTVVATGLARWYRDTTMKWTAVNGGVSNTVLALGTYDNDGSGANPASLFVGGAFSSVGVGGAVAAANIARYDGKDWTALGAGTDGDVRVFATFDPDGTGSATEELYAGGLFTHADTVSAGHAAVWKCVPLTVLVGDVNCDWTIGFGDINPFVMSLTDPTGYAAAYPNCPLANRDINGDGVCNFGDINPFVTLLTTP
jgi:hypothetical protein